ncbi:MAG: hypoxanthine phosphoribosyltransferase [Oscillospiraceae bacterium]|nr:hypoxanthine phosphoribosyltransferase [Oscillospiraceae bacterium]
MNNDIETVLFSEADLQKRIDELGVELSRDYDGKNPLVIGILKGVVPFYAAMTLRITVPIQEDFMSISSYVGTHTTGRILLRKDLDGDVRGRHVLILEDVLDSGTTLTAVKQNLLERGAASVKICTLFDKPSGRKMDISADYVGFLAPDAFIVGFGLDYNEKYRNLPYVGVLKKEVYTK